MNALLDPGSPFLELSSLAGHEVYPDPLPGAGLVTGIGLWSWVYRLRDADSSRYGSRKALYDCGE